MCIKIKSFCYCCSLRTGAIIAAFVTSLLLLIILIDGIMDLVMAWKMFKDEKGEEINDWLVKAATNFGLAVLLLFATAFLLLALLLCQAKYALAWLLLTLLAFVWLLLHQGFLFADLIVAKKIAKLPTRELAMLMLKIFLIVFGIYLWVAVYSYYRDLARATRLY